jgi:hypothetical protein
LIIQCKAPISFLLGFNINIKEVKYLNNEYAADMGRKIVETVYFEEAEAEKLELVRKHMGLKQNREVIKALICEKCDEIKLLEERQRKRQIEEEKAKECLEKGGYKCPM